MTVQELAKLFRGEWAQAVMLAKANGASAGAVRALQAHGDADVEALILDLSELPKRRSKELVTAWRAWSAEYVTRETARVLPGLLDRWPNKAERHKANARRQKRKRRVADAVAIVEKLLAHQRGVPMPSLKAIVGVRPKRCEQLVAQLVKLGAVRHTATGVLAIASSAWVREKMHALSPSI